MNLNLNPNQNANLPIWLSVSTGNGEYHLFSQNPIQMPVPNENIEEETAIIIKNKETWMKLSGFIDHFLQNNREDTYNLTKYTLFQIDEVDAEIFIYTDYHSEPTNYYYKIFSKNVEYENDESLEKDVLIYESKCFTTIFSLLEHIHTVEKTYMFLDYYLLSPEKMEEAKLQRTFLPIHADKVCSVCYEPTIEYTICKHPICFKCRNKCIVQGKTTCPICRMTSLKLYPNTL